MKLGITRRTFIPLAGMVATAGYASYKLQQPEKIADGPLGNSAVAIVKAQSYSDDLVSRMLEGVKQCGLDARGKRVLLKPNLVEFDSATVINTDASVIAAAVELFHRLGAAEVKIGEGPGHRRDTLDMADDARYRATIPKFESIFTDLNRDDVSPIKGFADEPEFYFPNTVLGADLIVSLAKMKTHHWAGATLSMKNFFGLVPGSIYGWPKNKLHYIGIPRAVCELNRVFRNTFAIVDGVIGMEGNGPIQGTPKHAGVLVMGRDLVAVDSTCCRIMGIDPEKIDYLRLGATLGHVHPDRIQQRGETVASVRSNFALLDEFRSLRLA
ncbi:MAG TPA: DUF362 domain-containing protein [Bryobacteraceae bacterium]|nr:DUF362 domain-containing protein [Bryobacteraceae bacterium]